MKAKMSDCRIDLIDGDMEGATVQRAINEQTLLDGVKKSKQELSYGNGNIVASSPQMLRVIDIARQVANTRIQIRKMNLDLRYLTDETFAVEIDAKGSARYREVIELELNAIEGNDSRPQCCISRRVEWTDSPIPDAARRQLSYYLRVFECSTE